MVQIGYSSGVVVFTVTAYCNVHKVVCSLAASLSKTLVARARLAASFLVASGSLAARKHSAVPDTTPSLSPPIFLLLSLCFSLRIALSSAQQALLGVDAPPGPAVQRPVTPRPQLGKDPVGTRGGGARGRAGGAPGAQRAGRKQPQRRGSWLRRRDGSRPCPACSAATRHAVTRRALPVVRQWIIWPEASSCWWSGGIHEAE